MNRNVLRMCGVLLVAACGTGGGSGGSTGPAKPPVASVAVTIPASMLAMGDSITATAVVVDVNGNPLTGRSIERASSAPDVAVVSTSGVVSGIGPGRATIVASCEGISDSTSIEVLRAPYHPR